MSSKSRNDIPVSPGPGFKTPQSPTPQPNAGSIGPMTGPAGQPNPEKENRNK